MLCEGIAPPPRQPCPDAPGGWTPGGSGGSSAASASATTVPGSTLLPDLRHSRGDRGA
jgi:hypothetical protein